MHRVADVVVEEVFEDGVGPPRAQVPAHPLAPLQPETNPTDTREHTELQTWILENTPRILENTPVDTRDTRDTSKHTCGS